MRAGQSRELARALLHVCAVAAAIRPPAALLGIRKFFARLFVFSRLGGDLFVGLLYLAPSLLHLARVGKRDLHAVCGHGDGDALVVQPARTRVGLDALRRLHRAQSGQGLLRGVEPLRCGLVKLLARLHDLRTHAHKLCGHLLGARDEGSNR